MGAAVQAFLTYPETCKKSLEEIEDLFKPGAIKPWKTKPGFSKLDHKADEIAETQRTGSKVYVNEKSGVVDYNE